MNRFKRAVLMACIGFSPATYAWGEVAKLRKSDLKMSPQIVVGEVEKIDQRDPVESDFRMIQFVGELRVVDVQKGVTAKVGDVIYVRYRKNVGKRPRGCVGARRQDSLGIKETANVRFHLKQDKQDRREILLFNGAEAIADWRTGTARSNHRHRTPDG